MIGCGKKIKIKIFTGDYLLCVKNSFTTIATKSSYERIQMEGLNQIVGGLRHLQHHTICS